MRVLLIVILFVQSLVVTYGQSKVIVDGDELYLRDSLDGKVVLLDSIARTGQNQDAIWVQYNRKPGVDPWIQNPIRGLNKFSEENFIEYFNKNGIIILGALTTYDDCLCAKHKTTWSPDMYLINFKISRQAWYKLKEIYEMENSKVLR